MFSDLSITISPVSVDQSMMLMMWSASYHNAAVGYHAFSIHCCGGDNANDWQ